MQFFYFLNIGDASMLGLGGGGGGGNHTWILKIGLVPVELKAHGYEFICLG